MPEGAVYVGRPTRWGNPFPIIEHPTLSQVQARASAVYNFEAALYGREGMHMGVTVDDVRRELADAKYLVCWCHLSLPCHVDIYLKILSD